MDERPQIDPEVEEFVDADGDVILAHYSNDFGFCPSSRETVPGFGAGCFFYPVGAEVVWSERERSTWYAPATAVRFVQSFEDGEAGPGRAVELFVAAKDLSQVRPYRQSIRVAAERA